MRGSERRLLRRIRAGESEACAQFVRLHYRRVYAFLAAMTGSPGLAEDLTQETFAAAWEAIGGFRGRSSLSTWLHRIAYNKCIDLKRRSDRLDKALGARSLRQESTGAGPADDATGRELRDEVRRAVASLDEQDRGVIVLHYFQGLSFREMARVLEAPVGTVKWRTSRALARLKSSLDGRL